MLEPLWLGFWDTRNSIGRFFLLFSSSSFLFFLLHQASDIKQRVFEFKFNVEKFQASVFKSQPNGTPDLHLADAMLEGFGLEFALKKFDMSVDLSLR